MQSLSRRSKRKLAESLIHSLEERRMLAAHIVGNPTNYATIQAAVDAAAPGATINVDAGVYGEGVQIDKSLTLRGARAGVDGRSNIRTDTAGETIITGFVFGNGTHSSAFSLETNNIVIDGFICQSGNNQNFYGSGITIFPNVYGSQILNCVIQSNILGLHLSNNSATVPAVIRYNTFYDNNVVGPNYGRGIYTDGGYSGGTLQNVLIDNNNFVLNLGDQNIQAAIGFEAQSAASIQTNITISNNYFDVNGKALLAYNISNLSFTGNTVAYCRDTTSAGLRFEGGCSNVTITGNLLYDSEARAIRMDKKAFDANNSGFTITGNNIFGNGQGVEQGINHDGLYVDAGTYTGTLNATNNWWGAASGPSGDGPGTGDGVFRNGNTNITFTGWATTPFLPLQKPYHGVASSLLYNIQAEDFDHGGTGVAYSDTSSANLGDFYRPYESPDLQATADSSGIANLYEVRSGEILQYTVNVATAGIYTGSFRVATAQATGATFHLELDNGAGGWTNISGPITVTSTGGSQTWQTQTKTNITFGLAGTRVLRIVVDSGGSSSVGTALNWFKFTLVTPLAQPPSGLAAVANGANVNLTWNDNNGSETGHVVEKKIGAGAYSIIATLGANVTSYSDTSGFAPGSSFTYRVKATTPTGDTAYSNEAAFNAPTAQPVVYLSDLTWTSATGGWGPVEKDMGNGGTNAGDGPIITLNGVTYAKGLGTHATSDINYNLGGAYSSFLCDVGVDDGTGAGTVQFKVYLNGSVTPAWDSGVMTQAGATKSFNLNVTGVTTLRLRVDDGGDGASFDWADWAGARLISATAAIPVFYNGTGSGDNYLVRLDSIIKDRIEILQGGVLFWTAPKTAFPVLKFTPGSGDDTLTVDYVNNSPIPTGGIYYDPGAGTADAMVVNGSATVDSVTIVNAFAGGAAGNLAINDAANGAQTVEGITFNGGVGNDSLTIASGPSAAITYNGGTTVTDQDTLTLNAGSYTFNSDANVGTANLTLNINNAGTSVNFVSTQHLSSLSINGALATMTADGTRLINTQALTVLSSGKLDLKDNDMVVRTGDIGGWNGSNYTGITGLLKQGFNIGGWSGNGIVTSMTQPLAARNRTTLGVAPASTVLGIASGATGVWQGQTVTGTAVIVKYSYAGDSNLSGTMTGDDYFRIDTGYSSQTKAYAAGDFDYNGVIDADDYFWMDNSYHSHGGVL